MCDPCHLQNVWEIFQKPNKRFNGHNETALCHPEKHGHCHILSKDFDSGLSKEGTSKILHKLSHKLFKDLPNAINFFIAAVNNYLKDVVDVFLKRTNMNMENMKLWYLIIVDGMESKLHIFCWV